MVKHPQEHSQGRIRVAHGLQGYLEMMLQSSYPEVVRLPAAQSHFTILGLWLGSTGGQQSGSLFRRASALQDSPAATDAAAICSVAPLAPVAPTLGAPGVLAGGGPVGPAVLLIWEGISGAEQSR